MGGTAAPKKTKMDSFLKKKREDAHRSLDRLFEIEVKAYTLRGKKNKLKRLQNAVVGLDDFRVIGTLFQMTIYALIEHFTPSAKEDDYGEGGVAINEWRNTAAFLISSFIPLQDPMARTLASALTALNLGEIQGIVRGSVTGKRERAWTISRLQLAAYIHTYFLVGQGFRVGEALRRVAEAYGYHENGANTVRSWGTRELKRTFGIDRLTYLKKMAIRTGKFLHSGDVREREHTLENMDLWMFSRNLESSDLKICGNLYKSSLQGRDVMLPRWLDT